MRDAKSHQRRRRLRLIQTADANAASSYRAAAKALTIAADTRESRRESVAMRRNLFKQCLGKKGLRIRVEHPGAAPVEVSVDRPFLVIGSNSSCDLHLDHEEVSPHHSLLQWVDGRLYCCDIAPRKAISAGGVPKSNGHWVDRQPFFIGPFRLSLIDCENVVLASADYSPMDRSLKLATEYPLLALQFLGVEQSNNVWPINRMLTLIGCSPHCKLRLNHKSIDEVQAYLLRTPSGCWLVDLANNAKTGLNGRAIQIASVDIGDVIQLGNFSVEVVTMSVPSTVEKGTAKPAPQKKFDRQPKSHPNHAVAHSKQEVAEPAPSVVLFSKKEMELESPFDNAAFVNLTDQSSLATLVPPSTTTSVAESVSSTASRIQMQPEATDMAVVRFISQQQAELAALKMRLDNLRKVYDSATGLMISKKLRDAIEQPVLETLQCYDSLRENLTQFIESVERHSV